MLIKSVEGEKMAVFRYGKIPHNANCQFKFGEKMISFQIDSQKQSKFPNT